MITRLVKAALLAPARGPRTERRERELGRSRTGALPFVSQPSAAAAGDRGGRRTVGRAA